MAEAGVFARIGSRRAWRSVPRAIVGVVATLAAVVFAAGTFAKCLPMAGLEPRVMRASLPAEGTVRLTFLGHASFLIETAGGVTAVTDYNGFVRPPMVPDLVTMNNAHSSHYADLPDPAIKFVLRGWSTGTALRLYDQKVGDLRVWNVPTNVREGTGTRYNGNSIFVFEAANLCIAHLGHLHHTLTDTHLGELGLIDVLLVPVDGGFTMPLDATLRVIEQINPPVVIPMHYFNAATLARFLALVEGRYGIVHSDQPTVTLSRRTLPHGKVLVLPGI